MNYQKKLKHPKWQKKRLEILNRDDFTCQCCGDKETELHVHHKSYNGEPWEADNEELKTLCNHCHKLTHHYAHLDKFVVKKVIHKDIRMVVFLLMNKDIFISYIINENTDQIKMNGVLPKEVLDKVINFYT